MEKLSPEIKTQTYLSEDLEIEPALDASFEKNAEEEKPVLSPRLQELDESAHQFLSEIKNKKETDKACVVFEKKPDQEILTLNKLPDVKVGLLTKLQDKANKFICLFKKDFGIENRADFLKFVKYLEKNIYKTNYGRMQASASEKEKIIKELEEQEALFSQTSISLNNRLKKEFNFQFDLADIKGLIDLSKDENTQKNLFKKENKKFVQSIQYRLQLRAIPILLKMNQNGREALTQLTENFNYRFFVRESYFTERAWQDQEIFAELMQKQEKQEKLFAPERVKLINSLQKKFKSNFALN